MAPLRLFVVLGLCASSEANQDAAFLSQKEKETGLRPMQTTPLLQLGTGANGSTHGRVFLALETPLVNLQKLPRTIDMFK